MSENKKYIEARQAVEAAEKNLAEAKRLLLHADEPDGLVLRATGTTAFAGSLVHVRVDAGAYIVLAVGQRNYVTTHATPTAAEARQIAASLIAQADYMDAKAKQ